MSDYISKEETINTIWKTFDSFADNPSNFELEETYAIRRFCFKLQEEMKAQPTLDEKEIIRKPFERVVERLEYEKERYDKDCTYWDEHAWKDEIQFNEYDMSRKKSECFEEAIDVVKEEGGIE